ncbi:MAG: DHH family phosphoesterase [Clostridiales bacterium]|nr:DHH family phosphoesterase [Clostridiales bacterium]
MNEQQVIQWLRERDNFLVLTHIRPDGDTLGCATALCLALEKLGKTAYTLPNPGVTRTYEGYLNFRWAPEGYVPEHIVAVDLATENLFPEGPQQAYLGKTELCIDHHGSNTLYAQETCLDPDAAAAGEVVYRIIKGLCPLDRDIAQALYIAISTDSGCFAYSNTTPATHRIAAELMEYGDFSPVNKNFFQTRSFKELRLQSMLMASEQFFEDGKICIGSVSIADKASVDADEGDCEELAAFAATIEGVRCAATVRELAPGKCKISLRTDPHYISADQICALLGGGGHQAAAGCRVPGSVEHARQVVYDSIMQVLRAEV